MECSRCKFYESGLTSNYCSLFEAGNFRIYTKENQCKVVSDDYVAIKDCEPFDIIKGENLLERL